MIGITVDIADQLKQNEDLIGKDLPYATALFLTRLAQEGQTEARAQERGVFKLRNDWTVRNTKVTPATKQTLTAEVYTDTGNRKTGAPDYLPPQETGGDKVPVAGHHFLAVPTKYLRRIAPAIIPDALRAKNLFPEGVRVNIGDHFQGDFRTNFLRSGKDKANRVLSGASRKRLAASEYVAFIQKSQSGSLFIFVRHGGLASKGASHDAEPWYTLVTSARIKPRFPMASIVENAVRSKAQPTLDRALAEVLANKYINR